MQKNYYIIMVTITPDDGSGARFKKIRTTGLIEADNVKRAQDAAKLAVRKGYEKSAKIIGVNLNIQVGVPRKIPAAFVTTDKELDKEEKQE